MVALSAALVLAAAPGGRSQSLSGGSQLKAAAATWKSLGPLGGDIAGLAVNPLNKAELYAVTSPTPAKLYKSADSGATWAKVSSLNGYAYDLALAPSSPSTIYVLSSNGVFKSTNGGASWSSLSFGSNTYGSTGKLSVHPSNPSIVYATGYRYTAPYAQIAVLKSTDGGQSWGATTLGDIYANGYGTAIAVNPLNPGIVLAGGYWSTPSSSYQYKLYRSMNEGASWTEAAIGLSSQPEDIRFDPLNVAKAYVATTFGVYRTTDGGATWLKNSGIAYGYGLIVDPSTGAIFAGYAKRAFKSADGGANWTEVSAGLQGTCSAMAVGPSHVYYASNAGICRCPPAGTAWSECQEGLCASLITSLAVSPSSPNLVYAEVAGNGYFRSLDYGSSWQRLPDFYRCDAITKSWVGRTDANTIYILSGG